MKEREGEYRTFSKKIWEYAEIGLREINSAEAFCKRLEDSGFRITKNLAGIPTAFCGEFGYGKPIIGILGEFDALEGLSQKAGVTRREKEETMENGHGCGHNLLGTGSLAAAEGIKAYMQKYQLKGTIRFYGCPGEEKGCGKVYMVRAGCFEDVDAVLTWHPMDENQVEGRYSLADLVTEFRFTGITSHASSSPHMGRSALDAVELLNIGCNYMREHIIPEARIHYAITDSGGNAPNIIPASASVVYEVRAPKLFDALNLRERICKAAQGAALMTETEVEISFGDGYSDFIPNNTLNKVLKECMEMVGTPNFTLEEERFAEEIQRTLGKEYCYVLHKEIKPYRGIEGLLQASTDVGDVSYVVPTAQVYIACNALGTPAHSWQMVSQSGSSLGQTGMLAAARTLAFAGIKLLENEKILTKAKEEHRERVKGGYICPIACDREPDF